MTDSSLDKGAVSGFSFNTTLVSHQDSVYKYTKNLAILSNSIKVVILLFKRICLAWHLESEWKHCFELLVCISKPLESSFSNKEWESHK